MGKLIIWTTVLLTVALSGLCLQPLEQTTLNPYTDSCDYVQRLEDGPVQVVCTVVTHVR